MLQYVSESIVRNGQCSNRVLVYVSDSFITGQASLDLREREEEVFLSSYP